MKNHRPPNIGQSIAQGSTNASPESTLGHTDGLGHTGTMAHPTESMGLKRRHFMGTALALDAAALLAACGGGGGGGDSGSTNTSGSSSGSSSASSSASGSSSSSASSSGSGSAASANWLVTTLAGTGATSPVTDGTGGTATFNHPTGIALDNSGNVYVAEYNNHLIRKISPAGVVSTQAGTAGASGFVNGTGAAAQFNIPSLLALDTSGNLFVADQANHLIRKISPLGVVSTVAGVAGSYGYVDGTAATAKFYNPFGVAVDSGGNVYVAEQNNHLIRKISSAGVVSTLAGVGGTTGHTDGTVGTAKFSGPAGIAVDSSGNLYVTELFSHRIRKITTAGVVSTLAGVGSSGAVDGTGGTAKFSQPSGVAVDTSGNVYVADHNNHLIRKINPSGVVSTIAGLSLSAGYMEGTGTVAQFYNPWGIAVDTSGNLYVADHNNNRIRKINR